MHACRSTLEDPTRIPAPGGNWNDADNGAYTITQVASQVKDAVGNARPAGDIGTFNIAGLGLVRGHGTLRAARCVGVERHTIARWKRNPAFAAELERMTQSLAVRATIVRPHSFIAQVRNLRPSAPRPEPSQHEPSQPEPLPAAARAFPGSRAHEELL